MKTIKQVSKLSGASVRTLQYYDNIKLLTPSRTESSYRLYDDDDVAKLQKILFLKELGFSLKEIQKLINEPNLEKSLAFRKQKELLRVKHRRVEKIIQVLERLENGASFDDCTEDMKIISKESRNTKKIIGLLIIPFVLVVGMFGLCQILCTEKQEEDIVAPELDTPQTQTVADVININPVAVDSSASCSTFRVIQIDGADLPEWSPAPEQISLPDDLRGDIQIQAFYSSAESTEPVNYTIKNASGSRYVAISFAHGHMPIREMYVPEGKVSVIGGHDVMIGAYTGESYDDAGNLAPVEKYYADFAINSMNYSVEAHGLSETEFIDLLKSLF